MNKEICLAKFDKYEKETSSTFRKLLAVKYVLISFGYILKKHSVQVNIGNSSVCRILSVGSSKPHQQNLAIDVFNFCTRFNIKLIAQWIPREQNYLADLHSRINDMNNWSTDNESFNIISNKYGPFSVDRFLNSLNKKVNKFNSKYFCRGHSTLTHLQTTGVEIIIGFALRYHASVLC